MSAGKNRRKRLERKRAAAKAAAAPLRPDSIIVQRLYQKMIADMIRKPMVFTKIGDKFQVSEEWADE